MKIMLWKKVTETETEFWCSPSTTEFFLSEQNKQKLKSNQIKISMCKTNTFFMYLICSLYLSSLYSLPTFASVSKTFLEAGIQQETPFLRIPDICKPI